jgi:hypothetical protein
MWLALPTFSTSYVRARELLFHLGRMRSMKTEAFTKSGSSPPELAVLRSGYPEALV